MPFISGPSGGTKTISVNEIVSDDTIQTSYIDIDETFYEKCMCNKSGMVQGNYCWSTANLSYPDLDAPTILVPRGTHGLQGCYTSFVYNDSLYITPFRYGNSTTFTWYKYSIPNKTYTTFTFTLADNTSENYSYIVINHKIDSNGCKFYGILLDFGNNRLVSTGCPNILSDIIMDFDNNTITRITKLPSTGDGTILTGIWYRNGKTYIGSRTLRYENYSYRYEWTENASSGSLYMYSNNTYTKVYSSDPRAVVSIHDTAQLFITQRTSERSIGYVGAEEYVDDTSLYLYNNFSVITSWFNGLHTNGTPDKTILEQIGYKNTKNNQHVIFNGDCIYLSYDIPGINRNLILQVSIKLHCEPDGLTNQMTLIECVPDVTNKTVHVKILGTLNRSEVIKTNPLTVFDNMIYTHGNSPFYRFRVPASLPLIPDFSKTGIMYGANSMYDYPMLAKYEFNL